MLACLCCPWEPQRWHFIEPYLCSLWASIGILIIRSFGITESFLFTVYCQKQIWKLGWASFWIFYFFSEGILWTLRSSSLLNSGADLTLYSLELHLLPKNQICLQYCKLCLPSLYLLLLSPNTASQHLPVTIILPLPGHLASFCLSFF